MNRYARKEFSTRDTSLLYDTLYTMVRRLVASFSAIYNRMSRHFLCFATSNSSSGWIYIYKYLHISDLILNDHAVLQYARSGDLMANQDTGRIMWLI